MSEPRDDTRDPRVGEALRVEPLDEVTRTRLVTTALARAPAPVRPARRARLISASAAAAVAAALTAMVVASVVGLGSSDDGSRPAATGAQTSDRARTRADAAPESAASPADRSGQGDATLPDLGDLGDVSVARALRMAVGAVRPAGTTRPPECALVAARGLGVPVAAGTGTVTGAPVTVFLVEPPQGGRAALVVDAHCRAGTPVGL